MDLGEELTPCFSNYKRFTAADDMAMFYEIKTVKILDQDYRVVILDHSPELDNTGFFLNRSFRRFTRLPSLRIGRFIAAFLESYKWI